jgi:hypothetical protein
MIDREVLYKKSGEMTIESVLGIISRFPEQAKRIAC